MAKYYAIKVNDEEYISTYYDSKYEKTHVQKEKLTPFTSTEILFEQYDHAYDELVRIINEQSDYDIDLVEDEFYELEVIELDVQLHYKEFKIK